VPTQAKAQAIEEIADSLQRAQITILADYRGLSVTDLQNFRTTLRPLDAEFHVAKNTLTRIAAQRVGIDGLDPVLEGPTGLVSGYGDVVAVAKAVTDFARTSRILTIKAGTLGPRVITPEDVEALSELPSLEELRARLVGMLASPASRLVGVLSGPSRSMAYLLQARADQVAGGAAGEAALAGAAVAD
jgi:large subunit ribosomal protein L10